MQQPRAPHFHNRGGKLSLGSGPILPGVGVHRLAFLDSLAPRLHRVITKVWFSQTVPNTWPFFFLYSRRETSEYDA